MVEQTVQLRIPFCSCSGLPQISSEKSATFRDHTLEVSHLQQPAVSRPGPPHDLLFAIGRRRIAARLVQLRESVMRPGAVGSAPEAELELLLGRLEAPGLQQRCT